MDNGPHQDDPVDNLRITWGPRPAVLGTGAALTLAGAGACLWLAQGADGAGALLVGLVTLALGAATAHGLVVRPRLAADHTQLTVRTAVRTRRVPWSDVTTRVTRMSRFGRDVVSLELDIAGHDPQLVVLAPVELGADPQDVLAELDARRPRP